MPTEHPANRHRPGRPHRRIHRRLHGAHPWGAVIVVVLIPWLGGVTACERAPAGARPAAATVTAAVHVTSTAHVTATGPAEAPGTYVLPVRRPVVDRFRRPSTPYGPGNRGWEFDTVPGDVVTAVGAGTVSFAGSVAGRGVVSVAHPDGLVSSLTGLGRIDVTAGQQVSSRRPVGLAGERLHLGFRRNGEYVDPALLLGIDPGHAVLVPVP